MNFINIFEYVATSFFAFDGTKIYLNNIQNISILSAIFSGVVTAIGGGTLRDLFNKSTIFWINQPIYIILSIVFSIISIWHHIRL